MLRSSIYRIAIWILGLIPTPLLRGFLKLVYGRTDLADQAGFTVFPQVFYNPFVEPAELDVATLKFKRSLPGIDLAVPRSLALLRELGAYTAEVEEFLNNRKGDLAHWAGTYSLCDSAVLYGMLRHLKPKRYIEVGCGYSSYCSTSALARNEREGNPCASLFIEPYPPPYLLKLKLPGEFIKAKIQRVPLERFQELEAGDVLFIDTSHVIKMQNDVEWELLHMLPLLSPGVVVHVHDIFTPYDYPAEWLEGKAFGANEQYALECVLSGNDAWEVVMPLHLIWREHLELLKQVSWSDDRPGAFWFKKVKAVGPFPASRT